MKETDKDPVGTSYHCVSFSATVNNLKEAIGEPQYTSNTGKNKTNFEWIRETDTGHVFTIYDWKEYRPLEMDEIINWHIGTHTEKSSIEAKQEIIFCLKNQIKYSSFNFLKESL